jgi:Mn-dependent DtxR family transcriptional regulator
MADITPTQGRYLPFIHAYITRHGYPPAESEIGQAMCVSPPSVSQMVKMLEKRGLIEQAIPTVTYPRFIKRVGKSPPQYLEE